jgi:hypothetical protein
MRSIAGLLCISLFWASTSCAAEPSPEPDAKNLGEAMSFRIFRDATPGCEPTCAEWIYANGRIVQDSVAGLEEILARAGRRELPILVSSQGGDVNAAMAMGRLIRARKIDVAVARTVEKTRAPSPPRRDDDVPRGLASSFGGWCASACTYLLAGAERRFIAPAARVGVHDFYAFDRKVVLVQRVYQNNVWKRGGEIVRRERELLSEKRRTLTLRDDPQNHAKIESGIESYLRTMGMEKSLAEIIAQTPYSSGHVLTRAELVQTRLLSDDGGAELLIALYRPYLAAPDLTLAAYRTPSVAAMVLWSMRESCFLAPPSLREKCLSWRGGGSTRNANDPRPPFAVNSENAERRIAGDWAPPPIVAAAALPVAGSAQSAASWRSVCSAVQKNATRAENEDYRRALDAEIKTHLPKGPSLGPAEVAVIVVVGPSGDPVFLNLHTNRGEDVYETAMRQSLSSMHTAPPPAGCYAARQVVSFH